MTTKLFSELGLSAELLKAIDKLGFEKAAPIQAEAIPVLMAGRDVVGQSQTGSGKTAAFAVPAIEKVDPQLRAVQVLILCPTRELAVQVSEEVHKLAFFKRGIHALPIYGGQSYERQFDGLRQGAQIVIGTPGRVMDHMRRGTLRLDKLKMAILDEVDVMLDMGFRDDIEVILQAAPKERQTVFFSATIPRAIQELIQKYSRDPQSVRIEQKELTVPTVEQVYYEVDRRFKIELLTRLIDIHDLKLGIIFCNTKRMVDDLVDHLNAQGYSADRLHGDMTQGMRDRVMNKFRKSGLEFLVATDVAARGIDVDDVQVVFNYDLPYDVEDYLHRIGRTGRAGRSGRAISFVAGRELFQIRHIERYTKSRIQRGKPPTENEVVEARDSAFLEKLRATLRSGEYKRQEHLIGRLLEEGFSTTDIISAVLHQLQSAEATPVARPEEAPARGERSSFGDDRRGRERMDRPPERRDQRYEDRGPRREFPPARGPLPTRKPWVAAAKPAAPHPAPLSRKEAVPNGMHAAEGKTAPTTATAVVPSATPSSRPSPKVGQGVPPAPSHFPSKAGQRVPPAVPKPDEGSSVSSSPPSPQSLAEENRRDARPTLGEKSGATPAKSKMPAGFPPRREFVEPQRFRSPQHSRHTPAEQTRLYMNVGEEMGVATGDVVGAILGETGLPAKVVGTVDIRERHLFVDVASEHANGIIAKLNRSRIKSHKLKVKVA